MKIVIEYNFNDHYVGKKFNHMIYKWIILGIYIYHSNFKIIL